MRRTLLPVFLAVLSAAACDGDNGPIGIDDTGVVEGIAFVDRDGSGSVTTADVVAAGVEAELLLEATGHTIARATTRADGTFTMLDIPVGRYLLVATRGTIGDTLAIEQVVEPEVSVAAGDTAFRYIRLAFPTLEVEAIRELPVGRRVIVAGIALNGWTTFADSTVHIRDATGVIRAVRMLPSALQAGDSVRVFGSTGTAAGHVVLADASAQIPAPARGLPPIDSVSTHAAARADGLEPNGQARVAGALVIDTATVAGDLVLGVDDGSGRLEVVLDRDVQFNAGAYVPGATFAGAGVLVPGADAGTWRLKPRDRTEAVITFEALAIADARTALPGQRVVIEGLALNGWSTYGDSTVHVMDATGSIRAVQVVGNVAAGDSIRVLGLTGSRDGQPVLVNASAVVILAAAGLDEPDSISTGAAAMAASVGDVGTLDASLVRIGGIIVDSHVDAAGDRVLGVDDGSGVVDVVLDRHIAFNGTYVTGATLTATGVLVPAAAEGVWRLKPRSPADAVVSYPAIDIAAARQAAVGARVIVEGLALNAWSTFADSTLHVMDATGSIRAVRVAASTAAAGDSVRVLGIVATRDGQPVLTNASAIVIRAGVGLTEPDSLATGTAVHADSGTRDAAVVRVAGLIVSYQLQTNGDLLLGVDDDSGRVGVLLDRDIAFVGGGFDPGALLDAVGVLVPDGTGEWRVKPRTLTEVTRTYPSVTIEEARGLAAGRTVYVHGVSLNGWVDFGDASVHAQDATAGIRVIDLPSSPIFAGDSVRILGTISARRGQPVLVGSVGAVLLSGVGLPPVDSVSTAVAATADGGALDALQVAVWGTIELVLGAGGDVTLTITDGSGPLRVVLDRDVGLGTDYEAGDRVRVRGVLVPNAGGTWELKPRKESDIAVTG